MKSRIYRLFELVSFSWVGRCTGSLSKFRTESDRKDGNMQRIRPQSLCKGVDLPEEALEPYRDLLCARRHRVGGNKEDGFELGKGLLEMFWMEFLLILVLKVAAVLLTIYLNTSLGRFTKAVSSSNQLATGLVLLVLQTSKVLLDSHASLFVASMALKMQTFIVRAVYEDLAARRLTPRPGGETARATLNNMSPSIYNVIFGDLSSLEVSIQAVFELVTAPIKIVGVWILLQTHTGFSANLSVMAYTLLYILSLSLQAFGALHKVEFMKLRDARIRKCHEYFSSLPAIRQLLWEEAVYEDLISVRKAEVRANLTRFLLLMLGTFLEYNAHAVAKYVLFLSFAWCQQDGHLVSGSNSHWITMASSISALHALNMLASPTRNIVSSIVEGVISFRRVADYFESGPGTSRAAEAAAREDQMVLDLTRSDSETSCLISMPDDSLGSRMRQSIRDLRLETNELCILSGKSGSGKSLLMSHVLEQQFRATGNDHFVTFHAPQSLWLPKGTVRSAILFGRKYDRVIYQRVIKACSLNLELDTWREGDLRQIDESDQTLSNGQKSRICLARTLYYLLSAQKTAKLSEDKTLILLDDIFSALDAQTFVEILENLFKDGDGLISRSSCIVTVCTDRIPMLASRVTFSERKSVKVLVLDRGSILRNSSLQDYMEELSSLGRSISSDSTRKPGRPADGHNVEEAEQQDQEETEPSSEAVAETGSARTFGDKCFNSKYFCYFEYIGVTHFAAFLAVCALKIGVARFMDIYVVSISSTQPQKGQVFTVRYSILLLAKLLLDLLAYVSEALLSARSSSRIHDSYLAWLLKAPPSFYSLTPISGVLNRFNLDLLVLDDILVRKVVGVVIRVLEPLVHLTLLFSTSPLMIPFSTAHIVLVTSRFGLPLLGICKETQKAILSASSSLSCHLSEMVHGWRVIRCFNNHRLYRELLCSSMLGIIRAKIIQISAIQWASVRIQLSSGPLAILLFLAYSLWCTSVQHTGYVIYFYITFSETLNLIFVKISSLEKDMCSLERIIEYSGKPPSRDAEPNDTGKEETALEERLTSCGSPGLNLVDVELSYRVADFTGKNDHPVFKAIKDLNLELGPNEHAGILGRTGCGKSTLVKGILGVILPSAGRILYNQVETCVLSRRKRREIIGVVPQTPPRVTGWSIRRYLDPFSEHSRESILEALKLTGFYNLVLDQVSVSENMDLLQISDSDHENGLFLTDFHLKYLSFVRLLLNRQKYRILLLDEPTVELPPLVKQAGERVDSCHTLPGLVPIENLVRDHFRHCCVVIISHNVSALRYCDRIIDLNTYCNK